MDGKILKNTNKTVQLNPLQVSHLEEMLAVGYKKFLIREIYQGGGSCTLCPRLFKGNLMNEHELTAAKAVEDFCKHELSDFNYFKDWKVVETEYYEDMIFVDVDIRKTTVRFQVELGPDYDGNPESCILSVDLSGEDSWQQVRIFDWTVKYFWMALLSWD